MIGNIYPSFPMRDCTYTDAVICVDAGAGMRGEMDGVKAEILAFPARYATEVDDNTLSPLEQFRVKLIVFGEGNAEGLMRESEVFSLPEQCGEFKAFVNGIEAGVTNSTAADALNAVLRARMFDWTDTFKAGVRGRQIIMLFTNSGMHSADGSAEADKSFAVISGLIEGVGDLLSHNGSGNDHFNRRQLRFAIFAPQIFPWTKIESTVANVFLSPLQKEQRDEYYGNDGIEAIILFMVHAI